MPWEFKYEVMSHGLYIARTSENLLWPSGLRSGASQRSLGRLSDVETVPGVFDFHPDAWHYCVALSSLVF